MVVFSSAEGIFHSYYLVMLAPAISALFGAGAEALWHAYRQGGWRRWLLPLVLLISALFEFNILSVYTDWNRTLALVMIAFELAVVCTLLAVPQSGPGRRIWWAAWVTGIGLVGLLVAPAAWAVNALLYHDLFQCHLAYGRTGWRYAKPAFLALAAGRQQLLEVLQTNWNGWLSTLVTGLLILAALTVTLRFLFHRLKGLKPLEKTTTLGTVAIVIILGISMAETALPPTAAAAVPGPGKRPAFDRRHRQPCHDFEQQRKTNRLFKRRTGTALNYLLATTSSQNASPIIIKTGRAGNGSRRFYGQRQGTKLARVATTG